MLNRRHIRIKILHILYGFYQDSEPDIVSTRKSLDHAIGKMQELYILLLLELNHWVLLRDFDCDGDDRHGPLVIVREKSKQPT